MVFMSEPVEIYRFQTFLMGTTFIPSMCTALAPKSWRGWSKRYLRDRLLNVVSTTAPFRLPVQFFT